MKRLICCVVIAGFISCGAVSAQEWVYLANGAELTITDFESPLEASGIVVGSGGNYDYGNRLYIKNGGYVRCLGSMYVNGTVSTGVDYGWLYSYASITGDGSLLDIGGDLVLWSSDLPGRYPLDPSDPWKDWGVPCHMEISGGAEVSVDGDISIMGKSTLRLRSGGKLTVGSDFNASVDGTLEMDLGGYALGSEYDHLTVSGLSSLDGTLDLVFLDDFSPANGTSFDLFNWDGGITNAFASINTPSLSGGLEWDTSELYTTGTLSVIPEPNVMTLFGVFGGGLWAVRRWVPSI